ncbi:Ribosome maturation factor RimP [Quillaja saponaria]|uniref:Ribosome maturation factor RimP n=1 Tax=Quillaja saponaria TaxID=32244 RepID=A0AAD7LJP1_QUISA|nr:Ribosome maturation factor RimP [Quillaja saponaria]
MDLIAPCNLKACVLPSSPLINVSDDFFRPSRSPNKLLLSFRTYPFHYTPRKSLMMTAGKRKSESEPVLKPTIIEEVSMEDEEDVLFDELDDEATMDDGDDYYEDEDEDDIAELYAGDGGQGGGVSLAGTWWDKKAFAIAEEITMSFDGDLKLYAFKTLPNSTIQVRIEKLSNKSGSPSIEDIEAFSTTYRARLDEAELAKSVPENVYLEVSSPGVERIVQIPHDLDRFKERPMYVKYVSDIAASGPSSEGDGIFRLVSFDMETKFCTWGLANVRVNREKAGKGRPLSKKQREWRLNTPFDSLRLVRLYSDI